MTIARMAALSLVAASCVACSVDPTVSASSFATEHSKDANSIVVAVDSVQTAVGIASDDQSLNAGSLVSLDSVLSDAQSTFVGVNNALLGAPKPDGMEDSATEMWSATNELNDSMKSLRSYLDDERPTDMTDFRKHWDRGRAWWNQAVTPIWKAAGQTPPVIADAPTAPPPS